MARVAPEQWGWRLAIALSCAVTLLGARGAPDPAMSQAATRAYLPAVLNRRPLATALPGGPTAPPQSSPVPVPTATPGTQLQRQSQLGGEALGVAATTHFVYVGQGPRVKVYERLGSTSLNLVGQTAALEGVVTDLAAAHGLVYAAATSDGVWAIDVSEPGSPRLLGNVPARDGSRSIVVRGTYAFVAEGDSGFRVLDLTDPGAPLESAVVETGGTVIDVQLSSGGDILYVMGDDGLDRGCCPDLGHLWVFDVSQPTAPKALSHLPTRNAFGLGVAGNMVYLQTGFELLLIDLADPTRPREVTSIRDVDGVPMAVEGDVMYTLGWNSAYDGLVLVDIRQPDSPVLIGNVPEVWGEAAAVLSSVAFVAGIEAVYVVDASVPAEPRLAGSQPLTSAGWQIYDLGQGLAYVGDMPPVLARISSASHPSVSPLDEKDWTWADIMDVAGRTVVAATSDHPTDVVLLDASDPMRPKQLSRIDAPYYPQLARLIGDRLYVNFAGGLGASLLYVYDVTDRTEPQLLEERSIGWIASDIEVLGTRAYLALTARTGDTSDESPGRLQVLDASNPTDVQVLGEVQFAYSAEDLAVYASPGTSRVVAYVATMDDWFSVGGCGLYAVDVSKAGQPAIRFFEPTAGPATGVVLHGDKVIVSVADVSSRYRWPQFSRKLSGRGLAFDGQGWSYPELDQTLLWGSWTWRHAMASIDGTLWVATVYGGLTAWK